MKTVVLLRHKLTVYGGAELVLFKQAHFFATNGYNVHIIVFEFNREKLADHIGSLPFHVPRATSFLSHVLFLRHILRTLRPDTIFIHENGHIHYWIARLLGLGCTPKTIMHLYGAFVWLTDSKLTRSWLHAKSMKRIRASLPGHQSFIMQKPVTSLLQRFLIELQAFLDKRAIRSMDRIITFSKQTAWEIETLYHRTPLILPAGVDSDSFQPVTAHERLALRKKFGYTAEDRIIMTVNRLDPRKRVDLLIKSFAPIEAEDPHAHLAILGSGPEKERLASIVESHKLQRVHFAGFVDNETLKSYYAISDIVAFPAWCAWGLVPIEALSMNVHVVVSCDAMVQEAIAHIDGVSIAEPDEQSFTAELRKALTAKPIHTHDKVKHKFDWNEFFKREINLLQ